MRLPIFLAGLAATCLIAFVLGIQAGFGTGKVALFVISVAVVAQFAYVGLVAVLAAGHRRGKPDDSKSRAQMRGGRVSQRHDT